MRFSAAAVLIFAARIRAVRRTFRGCGCSMLDDGAENHCCWPVRVRLKKLPSIEARPTALPRGTGLRRCRWPGPRHAARFAALARR